MVDGYQIKEKAQKCAPSLSRFGSSTLGTNRKRNYTICVSAHEHGTYENRLIEKKETLQFAKKGSLAYFQRGKGIQESEYTETPQRFESFGEYKTLCLTI